MKIVITECDHDAFAEEQGAADAVGATLVVTQSRTDDEIVAACEAALEAGADFVKTSTGFGTGGATVEDVQLMLDTVNGKALVKASGGVRDAEAATRYVAMGVKRLGTSNGIKIVSGETANGGY